jgi:hypothetical protein
MNFQIPQSLLSIMDHEETSIFQHHEDLSISSWDEEASKDQSNNDWFDWTSTAFHASQIEGSQPPSTTSIRAEMVASSAYLSQAHYGRSATTLAISKNPGNYRIVSSRLGRSYQATQNPSFDILAPQGQLRTQNTRKHAALWKEGSLYPSSTSVQQQERNAMQTQPQGDHKTPATPWEPAVSKDQRYDDKLNGSKFSLKLKARNTFGAKKAKQILPQGWKPSNYSVILGRGKCSDFIGNRRFRVIVKNHLQEYLDAPGKLEKSFVVSKIVKIVKDACPEGAFVKYENGRWFVVGERAAREKVGACFRDALGTIYKSSVPSKIARRKAKELEEKQRAERNSTQTFLKSSFPTIS